MRIAVAIPADPLDTIANVRFRPLAQAHAAAHDDAVDEGDERLAIGLDQVVERVLLGEEVAQRRIARQRRLVEEADVTAGAERAEGREALRRLAHAAQGHGLHRRVVPPRAQGVGERADHLQRQCVQRLRAVERDQTQAARGALGEDGVGGGHIKNDSFWRNTRAV